MQLGLQGDIKSDILDPNQKGDVATQQNIQHRAARFVKNDYRGESSVLEMIKDLGWQSPGTQGYEPTYTDVQDSAWSNRCGSI